MAYAPDLVDGSAVSLGHKGPKPTHHAVRIFFGPYRANTARIPGNHDRVCFQGGVKHYLGVKFMLEDGVRFRKALLNAAAGQLGLVYY